VVPPKWGGASVGFFKPRDPNVIRTLFTEVTGLSATVEVGEIEVGGSPLNFKYPRRIRWGDVTLKGGSTSDHGFWSWLNEVAQGIAGRELGTESYSRSIRILEYNRSNKLLRGWELVDAFPKRFRPGDWNANSDDFLIESVTLSVKNVKHFNTYSDKDEQPESTDFLSSRIPSAT
jgi:phage tail-like protein